MHCKKALFAVSIENVSELLCTPPERRLALLLRFAHRRVSARMRQALEPLHIEWLEYAALCAISLNPQGSQKDLAAALRISENATVHLVDRLVAKGLLERVPSADRRRRELRLTVDGEWVLTRADRAVMLTQSELTRGIPQETVEATLECLWKLAGFSDADRKS